MTLPVNFSPIKNIDHEQACCIQAGSVSHAGIRFSGVERKAQNASQETPNRSKQFPETDPESTTSHTNNRGSSASRFLAR